MINDKSIPITMLKHGNMKQLELKTTYGKNIMKILREESEQF